MRDLAATIAEATYALRATTAAAFVLRALTFAVFGVATALCAVWFPFDYSPVALVILGVLGAISMVRPDSVAPTVALGGTAIWWVVGGADAAWWRVVVVAMLLAAFHFGTALCAAAPPWARVEASAGRRMARSAGLFAGASLLAVAVVTGFVSPGGVPMPMLWAVLGAAGLIVAGLLVAHGLRSGD